MSVCYSILDVGSTPQPRPVGSPPPAGFLFEVEIVGVGKRKCNSDLHASALAFDGGGGVAGEQVAQALRVNADRFGSQLNAAKAAGV